MCLDFGKFPGFFASDMQAALSSSSVNGLVNKLPNSFNSLRSHIASCDAAHAAIYSASIDDNATDTCCFDCQLIAQQPKKKIKPVTDHLVSTSLARFASTKAVDSRISSSVISLVPWL